MWSQELCFLQLLQAWTWSTGPTISLRPPVLLTEILQLLVTEKWNSNNFKHWKIFQKNSQIFCFQVRRIRDSIIVIGTSWAQLLFYTQRWQQKKWFLVSLYAWGERILHMILQDVGVRETWLLVDGNKCVMISNDNSHVAWAKVLVISRNDSVPLGW